MKWPKAVPVVREIKQKINVWDRRLQAKAGIMNLVQTTSKQIKVKVLRKVMEGVFMGEETGLDQNGDGHRTLKTFWHDSA